LTNDEDAYVGESVAFEFEITWVGTFADGAGESAAASALLPPRCRRCTVHQRRALVAPLTLQPPTVALRTTAVLRPLQHPRCCNRSAAVALCTAATLCAAATTADAAAAAMPPPSFRAPSLVCLILDLRAQWVGCLHFW